MDILLTCFTGALICLAICAALYKFFRPPAPQSTRQPASLTRMVKPHGIPRTGSGYTPPAIPPDGPIHQPTPAPVSRKKRREREIPLEWPGKNS